MISLLVLHREDNDGDEREDKVNDTDANVDEAPKLGHDVLDELEEAGKDEEKVEGSADHDGKHFENAGAVNSATIAGVNLKGPKGNGCEEHKEEGDDFNLKKKTK